MKQIKCKSCGKIWYLDDGVENDLKVCPFCESAVKKKQKIEGTKNLGEAIYYALSERGIDMLASVGKITGFMYDTVPELRKEIKIFAKTFDEDYLAQYREAFSQDTRAISVTLNRLRENFIEEEGLSEAWADMLCTNCYQAIMFYRGEGLPEVLSIEITDYKSEQGVVTYVKKKNDNISASKVIPHTDTTSPYRGEKKVKCPVCSFEYSEDESGENRCPICNTPYKHAIKNSTSIPQKTIAAVGDNNKTQKTIVPTGDLSLDEILEGISSVSGYLKNWECNEANYPVDSPEWICEKAKCHYFGKHYCGKDENKAVKLFRQAANMHQFVPAYDYLGEFFLRKRDFQNSYKWYKKAADKNDAEGFVNTDGSGEREKEMFVSKTITKLTESEFIRTQIAATYVAALVEVFGWRTVVAIPKEYNKEPFKFDSQRYLREIKDDTYLQADRAYAKEDYANAKMLFNRANVYGNIHAGVRLGQMYWSGDGCDIDYEKAI